MNLAIRDYIIHQNKEILESAMSELKKSLDFDSTAIDHLHLALYSFQDAVITVLRSHSIKPHWMFALDNLVKSAVQEGITVLSPGKHESIIELIDLAHSHQYAFSDFQSLAPICPGKIDWITSKTTMKKCQRLASVP